MPPKKLLKRSQSDSRQEPDIISNFPSNVIDCILAKMPIREAVRTSVLSKKWRFYYLTIPHLVFDYQFCKEVKIFSNKGSGPCTGGIVSELEFKYLFDHIVTKSLMLHPGRIESFTVLIPALYRTSIPDVNKWISYLSRKNIKNLTLEYERKDNVCPTLPLRVFSCLDLTYLKLRNVYFSPPPSEFQGFLHLEELILVGVYFANNSIERLISSCPVLERLLLEGCSGIQHFNISGSKIKSLCIKADRFVSISL